MSKTFTLSEINKLGEYDPKFGQRYWGKTHEQLTPVMFNSQDQEIEAGMKISAEEILIKESKKGTEYNQLKKVKVLSSVEDKLEDGSARFVEAAEEDFDEEWSRQPDKVQKPVLDATGAEEIQERYPIENPAATFKESADKIVYAIKKLEVVARENNSMLKKLLYGDNDDQRGS